MARHGGYPGTPKPPLVAGREFCGTRASNGDRVMGYTQWGAFAEVVAARSVLLWPVPASWNAEEGAAFPVNFFTAYFAYWKAGLLGDSAKGARVLIHAVAGGVGTAAVQIGKILGVEMYGTSSSDEKLDRVKHLGLQHAINYKQQDYEQAVKDLTEGEGVDAAFEMLGGEHTAKSIRCVRDFGRVICYGTATGQRGLFDPGILYAKGASVHGLWLTYLSAQPRSDAAGVEAAFGLGGRRILASGRRRCIADGESWGCVSAIAGEEEFREGCADNLTKAEWLGHSCPKKASSSLEFSRQLDMFRLRRFHQRAENPA